MSPRELFDVLGGSADSIRAALITLRDRGELVSPYRGVYALPDTPNERVSFDAALAEHGLKMDPHGEQAGPAAIVIAFRVGDRESRHELRWHHGPPLRIEVDAKGSA